jgi:hypothetical protein
MLNWQGFNTSCPHVQWQNGSHQRAGAIRVDFKTDPTAGLL